MHEVILIIISFLWSVLLIKSSEQQQASWRLWRWPNGTALRHVVACATSLLCTLSSAV